MKHLSDLRSPGGPSPGTLLAPMVVAQAYLWFTVALFAWGPVPWDIPNPVPFYGFLAACHLALLFGYLHGVRKPGRGYAGRHSARTLVIIGCLASLVMFLPTSYSRTGHVLPDLVNSIQDLGAAYTETLVRQVELETSRVEYIRIFLGPVLALGIPLGIFFWKEIKGWHRLLVVATIVSTLALYVAMGTNKAIADLIIQTPILLLAAGLAGKIRIPWRRILIGLGATVLAGSIFFGFFTTTMLSRGGGSSFAANGTFHDVRADYEHPFLASFSPETQAGVLGVCGYLNMGYKGLSMSLEENWSPCLGTGSSLFLQRQIKRTFGWDMWQESYLGKLERRGWDTLLNWSTIYPWLASDFSFPGTVVLMYLLGYLMAGSWRDTLVGRNPFAVISFSMFATMVQYLPANNQLMQSGEALTGFLFCVIAWLVTRKRRPRKWATGGAASPF